MLQNLAWATGYNVVAIPLAAGALAWAGILMPPALAAALMSLSTIVVALNAQLLRRVDLRPGHPGPIPRGRVTVPFLSDLGALPQEVRGHELHRPEREEDQVEPLVLAGVVDERAAPSVGERVERERREHEPHADAPGHEERVEGQVRRLVLVRRAHPVHQRAHAEPSEDERGHDLDRFHPARMRVAPGARPRSISLPTSEGHRGSRVHPDPDRGWQGRGGRRRSALDRRGRRAEDVTGPYDVIVRAEAKTVDELGKLVVARIQAVEGITRTLTCPVVHL